MAKAEDVLRVHHNSTVKLNRAAVEDLEAFAEECDDEDDDEKIKKLVAILKRHFAAESDHHAKMVSAINIPESRDQTHLVAPLVAGQPYARAAGDDLDKLQPTDVRAVTPTMPSEAYSNPTAMLGLTAVPRNGQPDLRRDRSTVDLQFEHLFRVEDDERA